MNLQKTLLATAIAALPLLASGAAFAAGPMMAGPVAQSAQSGAGVVSALMAQRGRNGLGSEHGFAVAVQHPGEQGTMISRVNHTYKGVRVFGSESVIVSGARGDIMSESVADRRSPMARSGGFDVTPSIAKGKAVSRALASIGRGSDITAPSAELVIWPVMKDVRVASAANKDESELNAHRPALSPAALPLSYRPMWKPEASNLAATSANASVAGPTPASVCVTEAMEYSRSTSVALTAAWA